MVLKHTRGGVLRGISRGKAGGFSGVNGEGGREEAVIGDEEGERDEAGGRGGFDGVRGGGKGW